MLNDVLLSFIMPKWRDAEYCYDKVTVCWMSLWQMDVMVNVIMLSVITLSFIMLSVVMPSVIMLSVVMLNAIMLSVVAPTYYFYLTSSKSSWFNFIKLFGRNLRKTLRKIIKNVDIV